MVGKILELREWLNNFVNIGVIFLVEFLRSFELILFKLIVLFVFKVLSCLKINDLFIGVKEKLFDWVFCFEVDGRILLRVL